MKIDRVILSSNNNPTYYHFWNPLSKIYKENFGIQPTLVFIGNENEIDNLGISDKYGDIIIQSPNIDYRVGWQTTWSLFYFTKNFQEEIITIMGIDQVPLSDQFLIKMVDECSDDEYIMMIDDAYLPIYWSNPNGTSPSAYHTAKGSTFDKIFNFESNFIDETRKVYNTPVERDYNPTCAFFTSGEDKWGIDESYSSKKLREYSKNGGKITCFSNFNLLRERRIECYRNVETPYDINLLSNGWYSEAHLCRPYSNHKEYIDNLFSNIPKYK